MKNEGGKAYPQKHCRYGDGNNGLEATSLNSDNDIDLRDSNYEQDPPENKNTESDGSKFTLSEEGKAFLEAA